MLRGLLSLAGRAAGLETPGGRQQVRGGSKVDRFLRSIAATRYEPAQTGGANEAHWSAATSLSARQANTPAVRQTLRNRSRYEVANNSMARGVVDSLADDTIGEGPQLQVLTGPSAGGFAREDAEKLEWAWYDWADSIDLWGKVRRIRKSRAVDGEVFAVRTLNLRNASPVKLDIAVIEAERVTDPYAIDFNGSEVDGIDYDPQGNALRYRILRHHPDDDIMSGVAEEADFFRAEDVLHYFRADRPGQVRGIPEITPALNLFAQLRRYLYATVGAAEAAANQAQVMYTEQPVDSEEGGETATPYDEFQLEANTLTVLPEGWKLQQLKAEQPTSTFGDFRRQIANEIGRCLAMPINIVLADSSQHNFASGKLDHVMYARKLRVDRDELRIHVLDRVFAWWLAEAQLIDGLIPEAFRRVTPRVRVAWMWPAWEHADPSKEVAGVKGRLETGVTNLKIECARNGHDWQDVMDGEAEVQKYRRELGIKDPAPAAGPPQRGNQPAGAPADEPADQPADQDPDQDDQAGDEQDDEPRNARNGR